MLLLAVFKSAICFFGDETVIYHYVGNVECASALSEIDRAVHSDKFIGFVIVAMADDIHFAEVYFLASLAEDFVFKERNA